MVQEKINKWLSVVPPDYIKGNNQTDILLHRRHLRLYSSK
jgi:hypothetical protein